MRKRTAIVAAAVAAAALAAYIANELAKPMFVVEWDPHAAAPVADRGEDGELVMSLPEFSFDTAVDEMAEYECAFCGSYIHVTYGLDVGKRCVITATWSCGHDIRIVGQLMANPHHVTDS